MVGSLLLDLKQAMRRLRRHPGFTIAAVASLALGIGANAAIFRVINAVRFRTLPVERPQELVEIRIAGGTRGFGIASTPDAGLTWPMWREIERNQRVLSGAFAWSANAVRFGEGTEAQMVRGLWMSPQTLRVLHLGAIRGRTFDGDDSRCDANAAVLSESFWRSHFDARESIAGERMVIDDRSVTVIGVLPQKFFGLETGKSFDIALPLCARQASNPAFERRDLWWLSAMGRLAPNVTATAADAQIKAIGRHVLDSVAPDGYDAQAMETWRSFQLSAVAAPGGRSSFREVYGSSLWLLLGIAGMVLCIACANIANLLLVRHAARRTEIAVRLALGAGWRQLGAQLFMENLLLSILGAAAGAAAGTWLTSFLLSILSNRRDPIQLELGSDWRTIAFTVSMAMIACAVLGIAPAIQTMRVKLASAIRSANRGSGHASQRPHFQELLIGFQLAISLALLIASVSFVRSFHALATVDTGFRADGLVSCFVDFSQLHLAGSSTPIFQTELLDQVRRTPGVEQASISTHVPLSGDSWTLEIQAGERAVQGAARFNWVSANYFSTLGARLLAGRGFTPHDSANGRRVLVVNETFARQFCPRTKAAGTVVRSLAEPGYPAEDYEIVGVVSDTKYDSLREKIPPVAFAPESQNPYLAPWASMIFRATGSPARVIAEVRSSLAARNPRLRLNFDVLQTMVDESVARERLLAWLSGLFSALAALLTGIGLYGVIGYTVSLRRSEIAVRIALGAPSLRVAGLVAGRIARAAAAGAAVGLALALASGRFAQSLLFQLAPSDPGTMAYAVAILLAVSLLAAASPALRAVFMAPASALRGE